MRFVAQSLIHAPPERVFDFHELPDALERLTPPWQSVRVLEPAASLAVGERAVVWIGLAGPFGVKTEAVHTAYDPPRMFEDEMRSGPFRRWVHRHRVEPHAEGATLRDEIEYEPLFGWLGRALAPWLVEPRLRRLFEHRHRVTREWAEAGARA